MSSGMPELGSKISLISKADIRYEGRLFTVDPQECTIALANVRSFGTEERETQFPVAPQNQVYEYILFRGSDIKDISVVNNVNNIPNDPAIVQMQVQPTMGQQSYQPQPGYGHPMMGPMGGQFGAPYGMAMGAMGPVMGMPRDPRTVMNKPPSELTPGLVGEASVIAIPNAMPNANSKPLTKDHSLEDGVLDLISGGSRSTTPTSSLLTRKSPTMDQGTQVQHQAQQQLQQQAHQQQQQQQHHHQQQQQQQHNLQSNNVMSKFGDHQGGNRTIQPPRRGRESPGSGRTVRGMGQYADKKHDGQMHDQGHGPGIHGGNRGQRGGWIARGGNMRGRGARGRGGGGAFRNNQPGNPNAKPKNTLKFDNDYDFEQANTEFEELRSRLARAKIDAGTENEKKDDSGNETGAGEGEPEEDQDVVHYDKSKSFFDNISCEAVERSKGRSQRTDWRKERKLNSETFGVASTRRGGFRGRGFYSRGIGGGGGGGGGGGSGGLYRGNPATGNGGQMSLGQSMGGGNGGFRSGYRGQRGGGNGNPANRKSQPANQQQQQLQSSQNRANNEQTTTGTTVVAQQQPPQQQSQPTQNTTGNRLVTGTA